MAIRKNIDALKDLGNDLFGNDFLLTWEKSDNDLKTILKVAQILKDMRERNISPKIFKSGIAVSLFRDQSTRTRFSYASAANLLGLEVQDLDETKSQITHGETVRETANMISFLADFVGIRDDMYLGEGNRYMREVSDALKDGFEQDVLPQRPGVINLQCDQDHPTQSMADLLHLQNKFGSLDALKGKKMVMSWAYSPSYGKPLSVPQGIIGLMTRFGMEVELAHPEGYDLIPEITDLAAKNAKESGGSFKINHSLKDAVKGADIVYPKSWAPMQVMQTRTELLKKKDIRGLEDLEKNCLIQNAKYKDWEYNAEIEKLTKKGNAAYMHCLPADISGVSCKAGEISAETFEKHRIDTYLEAGYKPYIIAAIMFSNKYKNPGEALERINLRSGERFGV